MAMKSSTIWVLAFGLAAGPAAAQVTVDGVAPAADGIPAAPAAVVEPEADFSFGGQPQDFTVLVTSCHQRTAVQPLVHGSFQFFGNATGAGQLNCPVVIPNGARITGFECVVRDAVATDVNVQLIRSPFDATTNVPGSSVTLATATSTGTSGYQTITATLATPETVRRRNGNDRNIYWLLLTLPDVVTSLSVRDCTVIWNRQVSAPPATATFLDVPVGHPQRAFVEALAAAGITGGCGGGNYCPDSALTRGQMAVFLAAGLGLHFPN
jgi:hypothetical protein